MNLLTMLSIVGKVSGDGCYSNQMNKCRINFSKEENSTILGTYQGKPHTLKDFFSGETSMPLNTREDATAYIDWRENFAKNYYNSFKDSKYLDEIIISQKARKVLTGKIDSK